MPSLISAYGGHLVACRLNVPATFGVRGLGGVRESCAILPRASFLCPQRIRAREINWHFSVAIPIYVYFNGRAGQQRLGFESIAGREHRVHPALGNHRFADSRDRVVGAARS